MAPCRHPWVLAASVGLLLLLPRPAIAGPPPALPPGTLGGRVVAPDGAPVVGARVYVPRLGFEREMLYAGVTNADGSLPDLRPDRGTALIIVAPDEGVLTFAPVSSGKAGGAVEIRLAAPTEVRIPFVDGTGQPLPGRQVALFPTAARTLPDGTVGNRAFPRLPEELARRLTGRTDAAGVLTLRGMPQGEWVSVTVESPPLGAPVLRGGIPLGEGPVTRAAPIRLALNSSISGRVTYRKTGEPVGGARLLLSGPGYKNWLVRTATDPEGRYRFDRLFPARYYVMLQDLAVLQADPNTGGRQFKPAMRTREGTWLPPGLGEGITVQLGASDEATDVDFALVRTARVEVRVTDEEGRPVHGAPVMVTRQEGGGEGRLADIEGVVRLQVAPGRVRVVWYKERHGGEVCREETVNLEEGEVRTVRLSLGKTGAMGLRALAPDITVLERDGRPLRLSSLRGKVVVLDFWLPFGKDSDASLRVADHAARKWAARGVVGLAVYSGTDQAEFERWLADHPDVTALRFARDTSERRQSPMGTIGALYAVHTWPLRFVIGRDGTLRERLEGEATRDAARLNRAIEAALADAPGK